MKYEQFKREHKKDPGKGEIFRTREDWSWAQPPSYEMGTGFLSGG